MTKCCRTCKQTKPETDFYKSSGNHCKICHNVDSRRRILANPERTKACRQRWYSKPENKAKMLAASKEFQRANPKKVIASNRRSSLKRRYGLTELQFNQMAARQDFKCKLCGSEEDQPLYVDHIAGTKTVRGLLCNSCNRGLGFLNHDPAVLAAAARYVSV